ncbi:tumor necrosis factor receptor superfamily member 5 isoform X1 [Strix aluco]|uniref:tumor necrosis factor receptor superfamily member 5 isoform X1 n=1 Tax=Strix aluco TaxID=111821 RepID=UPI003DA3595D
MVFASSCCHCQIVSQSLESGRERLPLFPCPSTWQPSHTSPHAACAALAARAASGYRAAGCSGPGIHSHQCWHRAAAGRGESPLAPSSSASVAGEKLVSECNGTENSVCTRCESGHYQQSWTRERHCTPHDICEENAGLIVKTQGNATHNTACQCQAGTHCSDSSCQTCVENQPCQRGFGFVAAKAVARMSSPCEPCAEGTFSNVSSKTEPCHPWTSCKEKGLVVKVEGTNTSDVICESGGRSSLSVLIPITAVVVTCLVGICIYCLVHTDPRRRVKKQVEAGEPQELPGARQPTETEDGVFPVQETLLGGQPVAQEDGKESRISEQERL